MPKSEIGNKRTPSTTWKWELRRVRADAARQAAQSPEASLRGLQGLSRREPVTITLTYRGGGEAWFEIRARGRRIMRPGHEALYDLARELWADT